MACLTHDDELRDFIFPEYTKLLLSWLLLLFCGGSWFGLDGGHSCCWTTKRRSFVLYAAADEIDTLASCYSFADRWLPLHFWFYNLFLYRESAAAAAVRGFIDRYWSPDEKGIPKQEPLICIPHLIIILMKKSWRRTHDDDVGREIVGFLENSFDFSEHHTEEAFLQQPRNVCRKNHKNSTLSDSRFVCRLSLKVSLQFHCWAREFV